MTLWFFWPLSSTKNLKTQSLSVILNHLGLDIYYFETNPFLNQGDILRLEFFREGTSINDFWSFFWPFLPFSTLYNFGTFKSHWCLKHFLTYLPNLKSDAVYEWCSQTKTWSTNLQKQCRRDTPFKTSRLKVKNRWFFSLVLFVR